MSDEIGLVGAGEESQHVSDKTKVTLPIPALIGVLIFLCSSAAGAGSYIASQDGRMKDVAAAITTKAVLNERDRTDSQMMDRPTWAQISRMREKDYQFWSEQMWSLRHDLTEEIRALRR